MHKPLILMPSIVTILLTSSLFAQSSLQALKRRLRSGDPKIAMKALDALLSQGEAGKKEAQKAVSDLLVSRKKGTDKAVQSLSKLLKKLGSAEKRREIGKKISELREIGKNAVAFINDDAEYPPDFKQDWTPGEYYQKGQIFVEARTELCVRIFNEIEAEILKSLGSRAKALPPGGLGIAGRYIRANWRTTASRFKGLNTTF